MSDVLARYAFLPWMRRGLSAKIEEVENFNNFTTPPAGGWTLERPEIDVRVNIAAKKSGSTTDDFVDQSISLVGPGDIIGIDNRVVVKTEPRNWITNYEPNFFPYLEFYEEDFPWRYTPAAPIGHKLRPWLVLVALKVDEFEKDNALFGALPSILIKGHEQDTAGTSGAASRVFPNPAQSWAWAHVHLNGDLDPSNNLDPNVPANLNSALSRFRQLLANNPDQAVARMVCPRILDPNTMYHCFLLPAYETGRLAGLGADAAIISTHNAQESSFGADHRTDADHSRYVDHFPYYYAWQFMTGDVGDFESLVRKLVPREVDPRVGTRPMDIQEPGFNISFDSVSVPDNGIVMLEGALLPPFGTTTRAPYPTHVTTPAYTYRKRLADLLNLSEDLMEATFPPSQFYGTNPFGYHGPANLIEDDPIITPDLYGRWHALKNTLDTNLGPAGALNHNKTWFYELNLDPRSRAVAGLGVKHVKNNQEKIMDKAWDQIGEVIEANRKLRWGQFSQQVAFASFSKNLKAQTSEQANAIAANLYRKVKIGSLTAFKQVNDSALPNAVQSYAYRRMERPAGPFMKRMGLGNVIFNNNLRISLANKTQVAVAPKVSSQMQASLPGLNVNQDVQIVSNHFVKTPMFAPMEPFIQEVEPNMEAEIRFQAAVGDYLNYFGADNWLDVPDLPALNLTALTNQVINFINPLSIIPKYVYHNIHFSKPTYPVPPADKIVPVMAYPVFPEPMYESVKALGVDFLIPNLHLIPNNTVTLLESNQRFVEAFLAGTNHETGRELLWREFPTDQRGSYFRQFWDSSDQVNSGDLSEEVLASQGLDIEEIHTWLSNSELGTHNARPGVPDTGLLVMVIRGDLLKKFPDTVIYAQQARFKAGSNHLTDPRELAEAKEFPIFSAKIEPDITFFGFNLTAEQALGDRNTSDPGWFFVIQERPGEIRFGLDIGGSGAAPATWNDLNQANASISGIYLNATDNAVNPSGVNGNRINGKPVNWGFNSTNFAQILYQNPVLLAVHADEMIP